MKKFLLALLFLPLFGLLSSCSDDEKDLPEVDMEVTVSGAVEHNDEGVLYIEQGKELVINALKVIPRNGQSATIGLTTYYLDGIPQLQTATEPFGATLSTKELLPGDYTFQIKSAVYQIDKSAAFMLLTFKLVVTEEQQPDSPEGGAVVTPQTHQIGEQ